MDAKNIILKLRGVSLKVSVIGDLRTFFLKWIFKKFYKTNEGKKLFCPFRNSRQEFVDSSRESQVEIESACHLADSAGPEKIKYKVTSTTTAAAVSIKMMNFDVMKVNPI